MSELLDTFIGESRENLESASHQLLTLQDNGFNQQAVDKVFRDLHTIKGSSDLFEIKPLTRLAHAAEDLLDSLRAKETPFSALLADLLLEALDQISTWFDELETDSQNVSEWESMSAELAARLRAQIGGSQAGEGEANTSGQPEQNVETQQNGTPDVAADDIPELPNNILTWLSALPLATTLSALSHSVSSGNSLSVINYTPDADCFFRGEDPINVVLATPGLQAFTLIPKAQEEGIGDVFLCHVDVLVLSGSDAASLMNHYAYYEEQLTNHEVAAGSLLQTCADAFRQVVLQQDEDDLAEAFAQQDAAQIKRLCEFFCASTNPDSDAHQVYQFIAAVSDSEVMLNALSALLSGDQPDAVSDSDVQGNAANSAESNPVSTDAKLTSTDMLSDAAKGLLEQQKLLLESIVNGNGNPLSLPAVAIIVSRVLQLDTPSAATSGDAGYWLEKVEAALQPQVSVPQSDDEPIQPLQGETHEAVTASPVAEADTQSESVAESKTEATTKTAERQVTKTLKVNQEKIDYLMDLVGELTVAKNSLPYLARKAEEEGGSRQLSKQIKSHFSIVNRLTEELQSAVLQIRMVPVSHVFQRYPRLVRDLARKLNKKIDLVMQGEDTEFDKNLIESLSEPLIHLLRNSIDHGIEAPADRAAAGKAETGRIHLIATPQDDNVVIEIRDDGKGIDPAKIKMLAYQKGVITETQVEALSDEDALQLIFAPGFSTNEVVSDLSGRGVGMDAVKTMVTQAGGVIEMDSEVGVGTRFRLVLPQTMSVNRVMMFEVSDQMFGVSMDSVIETVKVPPSEIQQVKNHQVLVIREKLVPLYCLREYLGFPTDTAEPEEQSILVVSTAQGDIGLIIDKFHEGIDVIQKPLEGVMAGYSHFSGTALLGDGRVLLIVNIQELLLCR